MKKVIAIISIAFLAFSCNVAEQMAGTYQLTQCKYSFNSISGVSIAGMNLQNPLTAVAGLTSGFNSGSLPLSFTLNLDVSNPGVQTALLSGMGYILEIDGREMTTGFIDQRLQIAGGQQAILPINMSFDLKKVLSGESFDTIKNLAFNFAGIGNASSNVTVRLKPSFTVGNQIINLPNYIPVSFTLNKK